jgi:hypothetical protein
MGETKHYTEYTSTGNTSLLIEDVIYLQKSNEYIGIGKSPSTQLDVRGQIRLITGTTNQEGEIRYKDTYLWINTGGTINDWDKLARGEDFNASTDPRFYYDDTYNILYVDNIIIGTGSTGCIKLDSTSFLYFNGVNNYIQGPSSTSLKIQGGGSVNNGYILLDDTPSINMGTNANYRFKITNDEIVANDIGVAYNFRVESDTKDHMLFVDGRYNKVGINQSAPTSVLDVTGSFGANITMVTINTSLDETHHTVLVDCNSASNVQLTLPTTSSSAVERRIYFVKLYGVNSGKGVTVQTASGSQYIYYHETSFFTGYTSTTVGSSVMLQSYNAHWYVIMNSGTWVSS